MRICLLVLLAGFAAFSHAATIASGRHWRIAIESIECEPAYSRMSLGIGIRYLGPKGLVEAPVARLVDGMGQPYLPRSLVWKSGTKEYAPWLSAGGVTMVQSESIGEVLLRFDLRGASGGLKLEFGDIPAFALACESLSKVQAPRKPRAATGTTSKVRIYRGAYPCITGQPGLQTIEAEYPPYLPRQLLVFGRGFLPNARQIDLPMGKAPAQSYAYSGVDDPAAYEDVARRALAADFPGLTSFFAFNWGVQRAPSGNELYSIGIYDLRPCPK